MFYVRYMNKHLDEASLDSGALDKAKLDENLIFS